MPVMAVESLMPDDKPKRIDHFNTMVGLIFAQLYGNFPVPIEIDEAAIADAMGVTKDVALRQAGRDHFNFGNLPSGDSFYQVFVYSFAWLNEEGFIRNNSDISNVHVVLTSKALAAMNAVPEGLSRQDTLGSQLTSAAKGAGKSASNAAIGDLVGQVIGGVTKSLFS